MKTTLWKLLESYNVVIPIIQRDYAQGRSGKEYLRKKILEQIGKALNVIPNESLEDSDKSDDMDFVYGTVAGHNFYPLDGQQRLTTLWLLYWYVAYRAGKLGDENAKKRLKKFSYETRTSSREFCEKLCDFAPNSDAAVLTVDSIQQQTWFYSAWKQDPTIQAMLRMLSGTKILDEKKNDFIDGIEELFKGVLPVNYSKLWENLTRPDCPLTFSILPIGTKELPISDNLYVKMNARGKQLTDFENFKAELVDYIHNQSNRNSGSEDWKQLDSPKYGFAQKIDNAWADIFWELKSQDESGRTALQKHIDEIYFAFFNRYFFNSQALNSKEWNKLPLYGFNNDDTCLKFYGLEPYLEPSGEISLRLFQEIENILDRWPLLTDHVVSPSWEPDSFHFLPEYQKNKDNFLVKQDDDGTSESLKVTDIKIKQRAVFFAICQWLLNNPPTDGHYSALQEKYFQDWRRVVWNIVENSDAENNLYGALKLFGELASHCGDIIGYLATQEVKSTFAKEQVREECLKAKKIDEDRKTAAGWETKIREAENYAFFHGAIRFLFTNAEGDVDWEDFDTKWSKAKIFFCDSCVNNPYSCDAKLLRMLLSRINKFGAFWEWSYTPSNSGQVWRGILRNSKLSSAIHDLLCIEIQQPMTTHCKDANPIQQRVVEDLVTTEVLAEMPSNVELQYFNGHYYLKCRVRGNQDYYFFAEQRLDLLTEAILQGFIQCHQHVPRTKAFSGGKNADIDFIFAGQRFRWLGSPDKPRECDVYLLGEDGGELPTGNKTGQDAEDFYCFDVCDACDANQFKCELEKLIKSKRYT